MRLCVRNVHGLCLGRIEVGVMDRCGVGVRMWRYGLLFVGLRGAAAFEAAALQAEAEGYAEAGDEKSGDDDYDDEDGAGEARC